ncbi:MAG: hypothetical protein Q7S59_06900 [Sulfurimonas sp.]|nr:hypothetical protein [Sulfurimonas sp.]
MSGRDKNLSNLSAEDLSLLLEDFKLMSLVADEVHNTALSADMLLDNLKKKSKEISLAETNISLLKSEIELSTLELPQFLLDQIRGEISYVQEQIVSLATDTNISKNEIRKEHNKYMTEFTSLATNATYFKNIMEKLKTELDQKKSNSNMFIYGLLGLISSLQILILLKIKGVF